MNKETIVKALKAFTPREKEQCSKYAEIVKFLAKIKKEITNVAITGENIDMYFGRETREVHSLHSGKWEIQELIKGDIVKANQITITTKNSEYKITIPTGNDFYNYVCSILAIELEDNKTVKTIDNITHYAIVGAHILPSLKKAVNFVSKDTLRPAMTGVCMHFENGVLKIVSSDCHLLYVSDTFNCDISFNDLKMFVLPVSLVKELTAIKGDNPLQFDFSATQVCVSVYDTDKVFISPLIDSRFPDYWNVVPCAEGLGIMVFDKERFVNLVKTVMPAANKVTTQVNFHLNGTIEMSGFDVDFENEAKFAMPYEFKDFPDMDIAFNGKLLLNILKNIEGSQVVMQSGGVNTHGCVFSNLESKERMLLMPYHL